MQHQPATLSMVGTLRSHEMVMLGDVNSGVAYATMTQEDETKSWYSPARMDDWMAKHEEICCPFGTVPQL